MPDVNVIAIVLIMQFSIVKCTLWTI